MRHGIYVAASWRTPRQIEVVAALRAAGLDVPPDWELMYSMATQLCASLQELRDALEAWRWPG